MPLYDAFISYSHAKDKPIAAALQSVVQTLGKAWYQRRVLRVFRDDTSLSATPHLWPSIEQALGESRYLILLASPEAAASPWVAKEVEYWLEHKGPETLFIGVTDGELAWDAKKSDFKWAATTPLPPVLKGRFPSEPKWVDLCPYREGANPHNAQFIQLGADFAAAIRGMPKEDLLSQEVRQQRRALTLAWSAAGSLLVLAGLAVWQWHEAVTQRDRAEQTLNLATKTADGLIYDLARKFKHTVGVQAALVKDIIDQALKLQDQLIGSGETNPSLRRSQAGSLMESAQTLLDLGDTNGSLAAAKRARSIMQSLLATEPENTEWQHFLSVSNFDIGVALVAEGNLDEALSAYGESVVIGKALVAQDGSNVHWQRNLLLSHTRTGDVLKAQGKLDEALTAYQNSLAIAKLLVAKDERDAEGQLNLSRSDISIGDVFVAQGKLDAALAAYQDSLAIAEVAGGKGPQQRRVAARSLGQR